MQGRTLLILQFNAVLRFVVVIKIASFFFDTHFTRRCLLRFVEGMTIPVQWKCSPFVLGLGCLSVISSEVVSVVPASYGMALEPCVPTLTPT